MVSYLYQTMQEYVSTGGSATTLKEDSEKQVTKQLAEFVKDYQGFLDDHADHEGVNPAEYNKLFANLMFYDTCGTLFAGKDLSACNEVDVLKKGLHTATVSYWDSIRETLDNYQNLKPTTPYIYLAMGILTNERTVFNERMKNRFFTTVFDALLKKLNADVVEKFEVEDRNLLIAFIMYIVGNLILYFVVWNIFVESTRTSLWITKCMLGIIPIKIISDTKNILDFLTNSSKGFIVNLAGN
eukprot:TRINITY_DN11985_c0_g1_i3.p1 TRINITY_DN11985_c0_g1~~TRINITY_DN11985_c0_g1_i3.p1  ORF type:complete len:241 (-),score=60.88 TRINITY_DN11985_c0_g1_i3:87-809(-)